MARRMLLAAALFALPAAAGAQQWVEGVHYERLADAPERPAGAPVEVVEVFWYACPTCYNLEPHLKRWRESRPDDVDFELIHASLAPAWRIPARAFYAAEALGVTAQVHDALYRAVHVERRAVSDMDTLVDVFETHADVDEATFRKAYGSFAVDRRMRQDDRRVRAARVRGVPTIIINGKYVTTPGQARGYRQVIELIDHLVAQERSQ